GRETKDPVEDSACGIRADRNSRGSHRLGRGSGLILCDVAMGVRDSVELHTGGQLWRRCRNDYPGDWSWNPCYSRRAVAQAAGYATGAVKVQIALHPYDYAASR